MPKTITKYLFRNSRDKFDYFEIKAECYEEAFESLKANKRKPYLYNFEGSRKVIVC